MLAGGVPPSFPNQQCPCGNLGKCSLDLSSAIPGFGCHADCGNPCNPPSLPDAAPSRSRFAWPFRHDTLSKSPSHQSASALLSRLSPARGTLHTVYPRTADAGISPSILVRPTGGDPGTANNSPFRI